LALVVAVRSPHTFVDGLCLCVCVRTCVCGCVRLCACVWVCVQWAEMKAKLTRWKLQVHKLLVTVKGVSTAVQRRPR
jgi:hypothetical protein